MSKTSKVIPAKTLEELISDLPLDMKEEIGRKLITIQESPELSPKNKSTMGSIIKKINTVLSLKQTHTRRYKQNRLSELNREFKDKFSYRERLSKLPTKINSLDEYKKTADSILNILGDIKIKQIEKQPDLYRNPVPLEKRKKIFVEEDGAFNFEPDMIPTIKKIFDKLESLRVYTPIVKEQIKADRSYAPMHLYITLDQAKKDYFRVHPNSPDKDLMFEKDKKKWEETWDSTKIWWRDFKHTQDIIKERKQFMLAYDIPNKKETEKKINDFLKLDDNTTYGKYIDSMKNLPIGVKALTPMYLH